MSVHSVLCLSMGTLRSWSETVSSVVRKPLAGYRQTCNTITKVGRGASMKLGQASPSIRGTFVQHIQSTECWLMLLQYDNNHKITHNQVRGHRDASTPLGTVVVLLEFMFYLAPGSRNDAGTPLATPRPPCPLPLPFQDASDSCSGCCCCKYPAVGDSLGCVRSYGGICTSAAVECWYESADRRVEKPTPPPTPNALAAGTVPNSGPPTNCILPPEPPPTMT